MKMKLWRVPIYPLDTYPERRDIYFTQAGFVASRPLYHYWCCFTSAVQFGEQTCMVIGATRSFLIFQPSLCWRHRSNICRYVRWINFDIHFTRTLTPNLSLNVKSLIPNAAFSLVRLVTKLGQCEPLVMEWSALLAGNGPTPWSYQPDVFANPPFVLIRPPAPQIWLLERIGYAYLLHIWYQIIGEKSTYILPFYTCYVYFYY